VRTETRGRSWLLWIALGLALSPAILDWLRQVATSPWARGAAVFPLLLLWSSYRDETPARPARDGYLWLALGLGLTLVGVGGGMPRVGRPGIALAVVGLARAIGFPSTPRALLAAFAIPIPSQVLAALAPGLEAAVASLVAGGADLAGVGAHVDATRVSSLRFVAPRGVLDLFPGDGGLSLAWSFAGIGWFAAVQRGAAIPAALRAASARVLVAFALQASLLVLACMVTLFGGSGFARMLLDHCVIAATLVALGVSLQTLRGARSGMAHALRSRA
jgi:hypothetical protein